MSSMTNATTALQTAPIMPVQNTVNAEFLAKVASTESANKIADKTVADASEISAAEVDEALDVVNKAAVFEQRSLSFMVDEASGRSVIKVVERNTNELIRQIPSQELLKVAQDIKRLQDEMGQSLGFLIDRQV